MAVDFTDNDYKRFTSTAAANDADHIVTIVPGESDESPFKLNATDVIKVVKLAGGVGPDIVLGTGEVPAGRTWDVVVRFDIRQEPPI